jgi:hypothetical protein
MATRRIITMTAALRERMMTEAAQWLVRKFGPRAGIMLFVVEDRNRGGTFSYKSNINRQDAVHFLKEWFRLNSGEPTPGTEVLPPT